MPDTISRYEEQEKILEEFRGDVLKVFKEKGGFCPQIEFWYLTWKDRLLKEDISERRIDANVEKAYKQYCKENTEEQRCL